LAKNVVLKGSTMEQYDPIGDHSTTKKAATESKNKTQYRPVLFLVVSIINNFGKYKAEQLYPVLFKPLTGKFFL
jgi:hypothetical protein